MPPIRLRGSVIAPLAVLLLGVAGAACSGSDARRTATAPAPSETSAQAGVTATATAVPPTATPTRVPADPKLGAKLRYEGDFEAAAEVYGAVARQSTGDKQQEARLSEAQLLTRAGRTAAARTTLDAYVAAAGGSSDGTSARYMLASALDDLGDLPAAIDSYGRYIAAGGVLADFARVERAKLLARLGLTAEAEAAAQEVLASSLLPAFKSSFTFSMAKAFEQGQADLNAIAWYSRAMSGGDVASALARIGAIKKRLNDPSWVADYTEAVTSYSESGVAAALLEDLDSAGAPIGDYIRGVVQYRARNNAAARDALERAVAAGDHPAEAAYYLAALDERAGSNEAAIMLYERAHDIDPASPLADDALWWRGRLLEQARRYDEAAATYAALIAGYPTSQWASDAMFHRGLVQYRSGAYATAAATWGAIVPLLGEDAAPRARFWQGRALMAAGDPLADAVLGNLVRDVAGNFYALRAEVLLKKNDSKQRTPRLKDEKPDWSKIEKYLKDNRIADVSMPPDLDARWSEARELRAVGLNAQSDTVSRAVLRADSNDVARLYVDMRAAAESGQPSMAARAATTLIAALPDGSPAPPATLLRIAYPAAFSDLVSTAAKDHGVSPLLLLSLVRQESYYDPDAGSGAGALGLTQVVPATGKAIAVDLGVTEFVANDLYRPKLSLNFGASYLSDQLKQFDGNPYHALAAYNGGPGTASNAIKSAGDDEDLFVEDLEFEETQDYVRLVMENYARYRQLYDGLDRPSLER